jgi:DNA-binding LytR/AlgR family response regulator
MEPFRKTAPTLSGMTTTVAPNQLRGAAAAVPGLRCLVIDDRPADLADLVRILHAQPTVGHVATAPNAKAALQALRTNHFDVAFIEVALADLDGVELAWALKRLDNGPEIVFVTRTRDRAAEAFDLGALDYVTKPSRRERLVEAVRRAVRVRPASPRPAQQPDPDGDMIPVSLGGSTKLVRRSAVRWAQAQGDYVRLHTADGSYLIRAGMTALADSWRPAGLVRIHRSYLVQLRYVTSIREEAPGQFVVDVAGKHLPVSRRQAAKLRGWLLDKAPSNRIN